MIVVDTSAWIEFLRDTGHPVQHRLTSLIKQEADLALTETVIMEVLAGARSTRHLDELRAHLTAFPVLALRGLADYEEAAALYRACRIGGETVSKMADCLVAVPAIRAGAKLLQCDRDFEVLARHTDLELERV